MKLTSWRRAARPWLLLRPAAEPQAWHWARVGHGRVVEAGRGRPPADHPARVALLLAAEACSHFHLAAPPGLKRHEWPLLIEDRLLQPVEQLQVGCLSRQAAGLELVCVEQARLQQWQAQCAAWGLAPARCWVEPQLLPETASNAAVSWCRDDQTRVYRWRAADGRQHWLAWPAALGEPPAGPPADSPQALWHGAWPDELAGLDGLPGAFALQRHPPRNWPGVRHLGWRLPTLCLALAMLWGGLWLSQQWRQQALYQQQVGAVVGSSDSAQQAAQRLRRARAGLDERRLRLRQVEQLQRRVAGWLAERAGWQLEQVAYDGRHWSLQLSGIAAQETAPWQTLAADVGATLQRREQAGILHLSFDLGDAP